MVGPLSFSWQKNVRYLMVMIVSAFLLTGCTIQLPSLPQLPGKNNSGLQVITNEAAASLFLDGQYLDKTPYIGKEIKPGTYTLKIQPDDPKLMAHETTVTLRRGLLTVVTWKPGERAETSGGVVYEMEPMKGRKSELSFITIPDNAIVKLDEREQQFSPLVIPDVEPGLHQFEITLPSYETQKHSINAIAGHRITITAKLAKASGEPSASSPPATPSPTSPSPSPSASPSVASQSAAKASPSPSPRTTPTTTITGPRVTISKTNFFNNGQEVLRVRDSASNNGKEIGFAPVGSQYSYLGETTGGWYKISFNGQTGWVSAEYSQLSQ